MKLTVQDMNAVVTYMCKNDVRNVEVVASSISWETPSDVIAITESGGKYEMVKRPLNPPATELSVIELVGAVDVENGLESLLDTLEGKVLELYTCSSGLELAKEGESFYAWDKERAEEEGATYTISVPASLVDYVGDGEYLVGERVSVTRLHNIVKDVTL